MATIKTTLALNDRMSKAFSSITTAMKSSLSVMKSIKSENIGDSFNQAAADINRAERAVQNFNNSIEEQDKNNKHTELSLKKLLGTYLSFKTVQGIINQADIMSNTRARIALIQQEGETVDELSNKIYASAQRARSSYQATADIVTKLGMQAGEAFNNNNDQIIGFSELLNKVFTTSGLDATSIESVMYNLTQSLSSGALLGNDYRILKQNAPKMIKIIQDYFGVTRSELDDMVSKGKVSAEAIKQAMFGAADEINSEYAQMPITFSQAWTMFKNSALKAFEPVLNGLSKLLQKMSGLFEFMAQNQYIFYILAAAATALGVTYAILSIKAAIAEGAQWKLNSALLACPITYIIILIAALVTALIYLWNTNDKFVDAWLTAYDNMIIGFQLFGYGFKSGWYGLLNFMGDIKVSFLNMLDSMINSGISIINWFINKLNALPGVSIPTISNISQMGVNAATEEAEKQAKRNEQLKKDLEGIYSEAQYRQDTRASRVANRPKVGGDSSNIFDNSEFEKLIGTDSTGASALKTTTNDSLLSDEDIKLLLDVATRDYKLNYQQITPNVTLTFGDVMQTADIDEVMDELADRLDEVYSSNLEVVE